MAGIANIKRGKRCRSNKSNKSNKSNRRPPSSQTHKDKRGVWAGDNLKIDFSKIVLIENSKFGPDGWPKNWVLQKLRSTSH